MRARKRVVVGHRFWCGCALPYVEANYLPVLRFGGPNGVPSPFLPGGGGICGGEIDIERSGLRRRVNHLRIPQKLPVSGQFAGEARSILGILRIESVREHSRRPQRRQLSN